MLHCLAYVSISLTPHPFAATLNVCFEYSICSRFERLGKTLKENQENSQSKLIGVVLGLNPRAHVGKQIPTARVTAVCNLSLLAAKVSLWLVVSLNKYKVK